MNFENTAVSFKISKEIQDILIAWIVLSLIISKAEPDLMVVGFISVGTAFVCHELAHRYIARRHYLHAEFKLWEKGLLLAALLAIMTRGQFVFAAPGAVYISGYYITNEINGRISLAGPLVNLCFASIAIVAFVVHPSLLTSTLAAINGYFALFNLIPVPPLDGSKIRTWNKNIHTLAIVWALILVILIEYLIF